jgi:hypothetical protein
MVHLSVWTKLLGGFPFVITSPDRCLPITPRIPPGTYSSLVATAVVVVAVVVVAAAAAAAVPVTILILFNCWIGIGAFSFLSM